MYSWRLWKDTKEALATRDIEAKESTAAKETEKRAAAGNEITQKSAVTKERTQIFK